MLPTTLNRDYILSFNEDFQSKITTYVQSFPTCEYSFDTVGSSTSEQEKMVIILDELARFVLQAKQISEKA